MTCVALLVPGRCRHLLAFLLLQMCLSSCGLCLHMAMSLGVCLCVYPYKDTRQGPIITEHDLNLMTCGKILFPNKVAFVGSRLQHNPARNVNTQWIHA